MQTQEKLLAVTTPCAKATQAPSTASGPPPSRREAAVTVALTIKISFRKTRLLWLLNNSMRIYKITKIPIYENSSEKAEHLIASLREGGGPR